MKLKFPKGLLLKLKKKAVGIRNRAKTVNRRKENIRYISVPNSKATENITKELEKTGVKVSLTSGKKTGDLFTQKKTSDQQNLS